jgi:hypothetical protein
MLESLTENISNLQRDGKKCRKNVKENKHNIDELLQRLNLVERTNSVYFDAFRYIKVGNLTSTTKYKPNYKRRSYFLATTETLSAKTETLSAKTETLSKN